MTTVVAVEELRRAYAAVQAGTFRSTPHQSRREITAEPGAAGWAAGRGERVVLVAPCAPGAGATTVGLALATLAGDARVVECCTGSASALAAASGAELGRTTDGWVEGTRGNVLLQRRSERITVPADLPTPPPAQVLVTVLDSGWCAEDLLEATGWLGDLARTLNTLVLVARPTIPGLRRAESALAWVGAERAHLVLAGVHARRWPRPLEQAAGPLVRRLRTADQITCLPPHPGLAMTGLTPDPLPAGIVRAARPLLARLEGASK